MTQGESQLLRWAISACISSISSSESSRSICLIATVLPLARWSALKTIPNEPDPIFWRSLYCLAGSSEVDEVDGCKVVEIDGDGDGVCEDDATAAMPLLLLDSAPLEEVCRWRGAAAGSPAVLVGGREEEEGDLRLFCEEGGSCMVEGQLYSLSLHPLPCLRLLTFPFYPWSGYCLRVYASSSLAPFPNNCPFARPGCCARESVRDSGVMGTEGGDRAKYGEAAGEEVVRGASTRFAGGGGGDVCLR